MTDGVLGYDCPILLLPVRLETRFLGNELWVRIHPDQIFIDAHEPRLTEAELAAGIRCRNSLGNSASVDERGNRWRDLARLFGPQRAAWIARIVSEHDDPTETEPVADDEGAMAIPRVMASPDKFVVFAYRGERCIRVEGNPVVRDLTWLPTPSPVTYTSRESGTPGVLEGIILTLQSEPIANASLVVEGEAGPILAGVTDAAGRFRFDGLAYSRVILRWELADLGSWSVWVRVGIGPVTIVAQEEPSGGRSRWMMDLLHAEADGMAVCIKNLTQEDLRLGFSRIVAVGMRYTNARDGQCDLEQLIESHHYSTGLSFLECGTPTDNTQTARAGHSETREDREGDYATEILGHTHWDELPDKPETNAQRLGHALGLGLRPESLRFIAYRADKSDSYAEDMNTALWPATGDYFLRYLLAELASKEDLERLGNHFADFVRGSGHLPAIRIGDQPYGILLVTSVQGKPSSNRLGWEASPLDNDENLDNDEKNVRRDFDERLHTILYRLHQKKWLAWATNPERAPRVNTTDNPDRELLQILSMEPRPISYQTRPFVDERFIAWLLVALRNYVFALDTPYAGESVLHWVQKWDETWQDKRHEDAQLWHTLTDASVDELQNAPLLRLLSWWNNTDLALMCDS